MPKAKIQEEETPHPPEEEPAPPVQETPPTAEAPPDLPAPDAPAVPETPVQETVPKPRAKTKPAAKPKVRKDAPKKTNKKEAWAPGEVTIPQPPALLRQTTEVEPELTQAQALRYHLAVAAQERRAQAHLRVVNPIRQFYGL